MAFNPRDIIWSEKYRPRKVNEMVGGFKDSIIKHLERPKAIPNFLFYSKSPGTGKTTLSKCIINELDCDYIVINSSDDRKIDVIRNKVKQFARSKSSKPDSKRCIFLDEVDGMLSASQNALRNIMETYASNVFFIMTCNNINQVIEPLQSRCVTLQFAYPDKVEIYQYLYNICNKEQLKYTEDGIKKLVELNYPSIRNCVLSLQDLWTQKMDVTEERVKPANAIFGVLFDKIKQKDWKYVKKIVLESIIDPRELNTYFWEQGVKDSNIKLIQRTCLNEKDISYGADAKIIFVTSLIEMCKCFEG